MCGAEARTLDQAIAQARALIARGPRTVVITSAELSGTPTGEIETLAVKRSAAWRVRTPLVPISPNGTGDLFAALFVAACVRGSDTPEALAHAASAMFAVLERTAAAGTEEMRIVESADELVHPRASLRSGRDRLNGKSLLPLVPFGIADMAGIVAFDIPIPDAHGAVACDFDQLVHEIIVLCSEDIQGFLKQIHLQFAITPRKDDDQPRVDVELCVLSQEIFAIVSHEDIVIYDS